MAEPTDTTEPEQSGPSPEMPDPKVSLDTTLRELLAIMKQNCEEGESSIAIYTKAGGDDLPENLTFLMSDHKDSGRQMQDIYDLF